MNRALVQFLLSITAITDIVGDRIRGGHKEQTDKEPSIVINRTGTTRDSKIGNDDDEENDGEQSDASTLATATYTIACRARSNFEADDLAALVAKKLENLTGPVGGAGVEVTAVIIDDQVDSWDDPTVDGSNEGVDKSTLSVTIQYEL